MWQRKNSCAQRGGAGREIRIKMLSGFLLLCLRLERQQGRARQLVALSPGARRPTPDHPSPQQQPAAVRPIYATSPPRTWYRRRRTFSSEVTHSTSTKIQPMVPARLFTLPSQATSSVQNLIGEDWEE